MPPDRDRLLLALDFGGTKLSAALLDDGQSTWRDLRRTFSPPDADAAYDVRTMIEMARDLLQSQRPAAIGVSFGGPVDFERGVVRLSHHVPGWEDTPLAQQLQDAFDAPVSVDNDANVAALGEQRFGAGRGLQHLLYVTVSTGVGGGWILNGRPWRGAQGMAGEIGHTVVDPRGPRCLCGSRGCVERLASGPYMVQDARRRLQEDGGQGTVLRRLTDGDLKKITGELLSEAAAEGDSLAQSLLDRSGWALGTGIGNAANLVNPQRAVLGGGVTKAGERWWQRVRETANAVTLPEVNIEIVPAELGDDAPLWGAVSLAQDLL
ncbi:MAG: ROK family protein [Chloroflexota bacterium]